MEYRPVVAKGRSETLAEMMFFIERFTLNRAWNGLTDDEFLWEPMPGCWTVRPVEETRTPTPFVVGAWAADFDVDLAAASNPSEGKVTEPLTSIAWLFWHIGSMPGRTAQLDFLGGDRTTESGWTSPYIAGHPIFTTADEAVGAMRAGWRQIGAALRSASDEQLEHPVRFWGYGGPGPMGTGAQVIASVLNEVSHHGTQICVLRDLYRLRAGASIEDNAE
jgi:hypothetical protein